MFATTSAAAGGRTDRLASRYFPEATLYDRILTPMPVNPLCWEIMLVHGEADTIVLRRAMLSLLPTRLPAAQCPSRSLDIDVTTPLETVDVVDADEIEWYGQATSSRSSLAALVSADCRAAAFMRFARAPWLGRLNGRLVLGDLRYDREAELGFAEIELAAGAQSCPAHVPPWSPPRADLLP
jgi:inner membrane protein